MVWSLQLSFYFRFVFAWAMIDAISLPGDKRTPNRDLTIHGKYFPFPQLLPDCVLLGWLVNFWENVPALTFLIQDYLENFLWQFGTGVGFRLWDQFRTTLIGFGKSNQTSILRWSIQENLDATNHVNLLSKRIPSFCSLYPVGFPAGTGPQLTLPTFHKR